MLDNFMRVIIGSVDCLEGKLYNGKLDITSSEDKFD